MCEQDSSSEIIYWNQIDWFLSNDKVVIEDVLKCVTVNLTLFRTSEFQISNEFTSKEYNRAWSQLIFLKFVLWIKSFKKSTLSGRGASLLQHLPGQEWIFFISKTYIPVQNARITSFTIMIWLCIRTRKEGLCQFVREIKTKIGCLWNEQNEIVGFTLYLVDKDKEICAKLITAKKLYLIILNLRLKPNIHWEEKWKMIIGKEEGEWRPA